MARSGDRTAVRQPSHRLSCPAIHDCQQPKTTHSAVGYTKARSSDAPEGIVVCWIIEPRRRLRTTLRTTIGVVAAATTLGVSDCATMQQSVGSTLLSSIGATSRAPHVEATAARSFEPDSYQRIALVVQGSGSRRRSSEDRRRLLEDQFLPLLLRKGYQVGARSTDFEQVRKEIQFQQPDSGYTSRDYARLGKALNVRAVLVIAVTELESTRKRVKNLEGKSITVYETRASLGARLIAVEGAEILWVGTSTATYRVDRGSENLVVARVARAVAKALPGPGPGQPAHTP